MRATRTPSRTRTYDIRINNPPLCQLSYRGKVVAIPSSGFERSRPSAPLLQDLLVIPVGIVRLELTTSRSRSGRAPYCAIFRLTPSTLTLGLLGFSPRGPCSSDSGGRSDSPSRQQVPFPDEAWAADTVSCVLRSNLRLFKISGTT